MSPWLRYEETTPQSRKVGRIAKGLRGQPQSVDAQALGHLLAMWSWAFRNCDDDGRFQAEDTWHMERACSWHGDEGALADIFIRAGVLEQEGEMLKVTDWDDCPGWTRDHLRSDAGKKRRQRERQRQEIRGDVPGDVPPKTRQDKTEKDRKEEIDETQSCAYQVPSSKGSQSLRSVADEIATILLNHGLWSISAAQTAQIALEMAVEHRDIDLVSQAQAFLDYSIEHGPPHDWVEALRGWMKNAWTDSEDEGWNFDLEASDADLA